MTKFSNFSILSRNSNSYAPFSTSSCLSQSSEINDPFVQNIPFYYGPNIHNNSSVKITLSYLDLINQDVFCDMIKPNLLLNNEYTVFVKIKLVDDSHRMCGDQFGFSYNSVDSLVNLNEKIIIRLNFMLENAVSDVQLKNIKFYLLDFRGIDKQLLSEFKESDITDTESSVSGLEQRVITQSLVKPKTLIPVSVNEDHIGIPLKTRSKDNNIFYIEFPEGSIMCNFMDRILKQSSYLKPNHKSRIDYLDSDYSFYRVVYNNVVNVFATKLINSHTISKLRFHNDGSLIAKVTDVVDSNNVVHRSIDNKELIIYDKKLYAYKQHFNLKSIDKGNPKVFATENKNIGVIDTETFKDNDNKYKIFAAGIKSYMRDPIIFYIDEKTKDSDKVVLDFVDEILRPLYKEINLYCHNLGGYDVVFILNVLLKHSDIYKVSCGFRDDVIIKLTISKTVDNVTYKVSIKDSYAILNSSQRKLSENFEVDSIKSYFPHKFSTRDNLFYKGVTPDKHYYKFEYDKNDIDNINIYNSYYKDDWDFKKELIKYLQIDLLGLYEIISKANKQFFLDYKINMTEKGTISGLASSIFLKDHYNNNIPHITTPSIYSDIKQAYYGGMTEVYKPSGKDLYYYDVNSLYPYVALNDMPGLFCDKLYYYNNNNPRLNDLFGFYYCEIDTPLNSYLGVLPFRGKTGLTFPLGKWKGWYFSEELKYAESQGYKIKVIQGYNFDRVTDVFKSYVDNIYNIKSNSINQTQKSIAKSLLNNLLGRFGIRFEKPITDIVSNATFNRLSTMYKIVSFKELESDKVLVNYVPKLDTDLIKSLKLDINKIINKYGDGESKWDPLSSVAISAAITSYGRIHMNKIKRDILANSGNIYYTDTDSIVTDIKLSDHLVDSKSLGKLKLEHKIKQGIFISGKTYCLVNDDDKIITRAKGVNPSELKLNDYISMLEGNVVKDIVSTQSSKDYTKGHVIISDIFKMLDGSVYNKRNKIFNNNMWVDTKPIIININESVQSNKVSRRNDYTILSLLLVSWIVLLSWIAYILVYEDLNEGSNIETQESIIEESNNDNSNTKETNNNIVVDTKFINGSKDLEYSTTNYESSDESESNDEVEHQEILKNYTKVENIEETETKSGSQEAKYLTKIGGKTRSYTDDMEDLNLDDLFESNKEDLQNQVSYLESTLDRLSSRIKTWIRPQSTDDSSTSLETNDKVSTKSIETNNNTKDMTSSDNKLQQTWKSDRSLDKSLDDQVHEKEEHHDWKDNVDSFDLDKLFNSEEDGPSKKNNKTLKEDSINNLLDHYNYPRNSEPDSESGSEK